MTSHRVSVFRLLFPPICAYCGDDLPAWKSDRLCAACQHLLYASDLRRCGHCGGILGPTAIDQQACGLCRSANYAFDRAVALGAYQGALRDVVLRMKRGHERYLACAIGELMARHVAAQFDTDLPDLFVPAPMHWRRRLQRGGSSAETMSEVVAKTLGIPVDNRIVGCRRNTKKQSTLAPAERRKNVSNAYQAVAQLQLAGLHVCLVDDTLTTGATANELARILSQHDARRVTLVVVARATGHTS